MITRIRIEAAGATADEVERTLYPHADLIEKMLNISVGRGECVIERDVAEMEASRWAFKGRLLLHPDVSENPLSLADYAEIARQQGTANNATVVGRLAE